MGWASGVNVLDDVIGAMQKNVKCFTNQERHIITVEIVKTFMDNDCDTLDDSNYCDEKWFRQVLYDAGWYREDPDMGDTWCDKHAFMCWSSVDCPECEAEHLAHPDPCDYCLGEGWYLRLVSDDTVTGRVLERVECPCTVEPEPEATCRGCCDTCSGSGIGGDAETNGMCWDCRGTGCPHD